MRCGSSVKKTLTELIAEVNQQTCDIPTTDSKKVLSALNMALGDWGIRSAGTCHCINLGKVTGRCSVKLPCINYLTLRLYVKSDSCCHPTFTSECCDNCYKELTVFDETCGEIVIPHGICGDIRAEITTTPCPLTLDTLTLARDFTPTSTEIWLRGTPDICSPGWLKIGGELWVEYGEISRRQINSNDKFDLEANNAWVDATGNKTVEIPAGGIAQPTLFRPDQESLVVDAPCGQMTRLTNVTRDCSHVQSKTYEAGSATLVEEGIAADSALPFRALLLRASAELYRSNICKCTTDGDRAFYRQMWVDSNALSAASWEGYGTRVARIKNSPEVWWDTRDGCCTPRYITNSRSCGRGARRYGRHRF